MIRPILKEQKGSVMIEAAIIAPVLFTLVLGLWDVGNLLYLHAQMTQIAREFTRSASVIPGLEEGVFEKRYDGTAYVCRQKIGQAYQDCAGAGRQAALLETIYNQVLAAGQGWRVDDKSILITCNLNKNPNVDTVQLDLQIRYIGISPYLGSNLSIAVSATGPFL